MAPAAASPPPALAPAPAPSSATSTAPASASREPAQTLALGESPAIATNTGVKMEVAWMRNAPRVAVVY